MVDGWCCLLLLLLLLPLFFTRIFSFILCCAVCIAFTSNAGYMRRISHLATSITSTVWPNTHTHNGIMYLIRSVMLNEAKNTYYTKWNKTQQQHNKTASNLTDETLPDWIPWHSCYAVLLLLNGKIIQQKFHVWASRFCDTNMSLEFRTGIL